MLQPATYVSSMPIALQQHQLHKERLERIKKAAFKELTKPLPDWPIAIPTEYPREPDKYFSISELIIHTVCKRYHVKKEDITSNRRFGNVVKARHAIIVMLYHFTKWTNFKIADKVNRDPSVVFYVLQKQERTPIDFSELERQIQDKLPLINARI